MPTSSSLALAVVALVMIGCLDATSPPKRTVVDIRLDGPPVPSLSETANGPEIACTVGLTAAGTGRGRATWGAARTLWFVGADRSAAVDTTVRQALEIRSAWGAETIAAGETRHASLTFRRSAPFDVTLHFTYAAGGGGQESVATTRFSCGPTPGETAPFVTRVGLVTGPDLGSGDSISVSYSGASSTGLWKTVIRTSGAFSAEHVVAERLASSVNHTVRSAIPADARLDIPLTVSAVLYDAALRTRSLAVTAQLSPAP
jgi:hypothetical protein